MPYAYDPDFAGPPAPDGALTTPSAKGSGARGGAASAAETFVGPRAPGKEPRTTTLSTHENSMLVTRTIYEDNFTGPHPPLEYEDNEQRSGVLPYRTRSTWNAHAILESLTQVDNDPETTTDGMRCSATAVLGAPILEGPHAVAATAVAVMDRVRAMLAKGDLAARNQGLADNLRRMLPYMATVPKRMLSLKGTYKDLRRLAHMLKGAETWSESLGTTVDQLGEMSNRTGGVTFLATAFKDRDGALLHSASAVEAFLLQAGSFGATTMLAIRDQQDNGEETSHSVLAGCDARGPWVYDPWPRPGQQILYFRQNRRELELLLNTSARRKPTLVQSIRMPGNGLIR